MAGPMRGGIVNILVWVLPNTLVRVSILPHSWGIAIGHSWGIMMGHSWGTAMGHSWGIFKGI